MLSGNRESDVLAINSSTLLSATTAEDSKKTFRCDLWSFISFNFYALNISRHFITEDR